MTAHQTARWEAPAEYVQPYDRSAAAYALATERAARLIEQRSIRH